MIIKLKNLALDEIHPIAHFNKRELYLTSRSVKEIAFELGYEDEFYFSRYFKKKVGVSPQIFRDTVGFDKLKT